MKDEGSHHIGSNDLVGQDCTELLCQFQGIYYVNLSTNKTWQNYHISSVKKKKRMFSSKKQSQKI